MHFEYLIDPESSFVGTTRMVLTSTRYLDCYYQYEIPAHEIPEWYNLSKKPGCLLPTWDIWICIYLHAIPG